MRTASSVWSVESLHGRCWPWVGEEIGTSYVAVNADFMDTRAPAVAALTGK
jgi:hypothetical protein